MVDTMQTAQQHLLKNDPILRPVILAVGDCPLKSHDRYYQELVESIIGQQLSIKAAATIAARFVDLFDGKFPSPQQILAESHERLRTAGLSNAKANYIRDLAQHIVDGKLAIEKLPSLSNDQVTSELVAVKGIGEWTAHMFLMFSLGRLDVLPVGDLGLKTGIQKLYKLKQLPTSVDITTIAKKYSWHPFESVASWYVWQSLKL